MPLMQPTLTSADGQRTFACSAAAVLAFVFDSRERLLLLAPPESPDEWEVISGGMEADETVLEAMLREIREEAGPDFNVRPLANLHTSSFHYDDAVGRLISVAFVLAHEGGQVVASDDMAGAKVHWASLEEIESGQLKVVVPQQKWMFRRALRLYRMFKDEPAVDLG